jgi:drug/metabolite transporter (DMT)-like permease
MNGIILCSALFVAFLWGVAPVIHKRVLYTTPVPVVMVIGGAFYMSCLLLFAIYNRKEVVVGIQQLPWSYIFLIGLTSICTAFVANILYFYVLKKYDSYIISALIYSSPIFTLLLAFLFLKENITINGFIGVMLIVVGISYLAFNKQPSH